MKSALPVSFGGRRCFLVVVGAALGQFACTDIEKPNAMAKVAVFVKPNERWKADHFFDFLRALPPAAMLDLQKSIGLMSQSSGLDQLQSPEQNARTIQRRLLRISSNVFSRPFKDAETLDYHEVVTWAADKIGVANGTIESSSTFALERELYKPLFVELWDRLNARQREELLSRWGVREAVKDAASITALSGAGALAALSGTVAFTGFAFYTTMSVTIAAAASAVGLTLPFAAYAGASSIVGTLAGPIGWAMMTVAGLGGLALAGRANSRETASLILQTHALKIEALRAAGVTKSEIFSVSAS